MMALATYTKFLYPSTYPPSIGSVVCPVTLLMQTLSNGSSVYRGHVASIITMIEEERGCLDVAQQLQAVEKAIANAKNFA